MSIHQISQEIAKSICVRNGTPEKENVITYGVELILSETSKMILLMTAAYFLGILAPVLLITLPSALLRSVTGGQHCSSNLRCTTMTLITFLSLGAIVNLLIQNIEGISWFLMYSLLCSVCFVMVIEHGGPGYSVNYPEPSSEQINKAKKRAYLLLTFWLILCVLLFFVASPAVIALVLAATGTGVVWQAFSLTKTGHRFLIGADKLLILLKIR